MPAITRDAPTRPRRRPSAIGEFLSTETLGGIVLLVAVAAAIVWANVAPGAYRSFWSHEVTVGIGDLAVTETLAQWVTEGLMTIFFFVVGLEIKRELVRGELRDPRRAALPAIAAVGGMVVPAALFVVLNVGQTTADGWGIPMATDIAFAVAVLALLGSRIPRPLKVFLLTLAIVDDIGAIIVIALFYSHGVSGVWLLTAALVVVGIVAMRGFGLTHPAWFVVPAVALWYCCLESGIHPTIAGVALGLLAPTGQVGGRPLLEQLEHRLHPWSSLLIVPLFALASAGVVLDVESLRHAAGSSVAWGVVVGLVIGKPLGIFLASVVALQVRVGRLPSGLRRSHLLGAGCLAGIGFTVSLFVADLAFRGVALRDAKLGILVASLSSTAIGAAALITVAKRTRAVRLVEVRGNDEEVEWRLARFVTVQPTARAADLPPLRPPDPAEIDADSRPTLDDDGLLRFRGRWVAVPDAQIPVVRLLVDRFQTTVSDDDLAVAFRGAGDGDVARKLAGALHRLRGRVKECGLALSRVRSRGYILDHAQAGVMSRSDNEVSPSGSAANL